MNESPPFARLASASVLVIAALLLLPLPGHPQCVISWPPRPEAEQVTSYKLYANDTFLTSLTDTPLRASELGLNDGRPHVLEVSAVNMGGEGERSPPYVYVYTLPPPGQVEAPNTVGCVDVQSAGGCQ